MPRLHRDDPDVAALVGGWPIMWLLDIPDIGTLTCYGAPRCIVHVVDYINGQGWDAYVPYETLSIKATVEQLRRRALPPSASEEPSYPTEEAIAEWYRGYQPLDPDGLCMDIVDGVKFGVDWARKERSGG